MWFIKVMRFFKLLYCPLSLKIPVSQIIYVDDALNDISHFKKFIKWQHYVL